MIKGETIKPKDTIIRPDVNYRELGALNCSMIKLFDNDPILFYQQFKLGRKKKDKKNGSLIIGDLVDFYLLDCNGNEEEFHNRFDEKFSLFEGTRGSGQVFLLADALFDITQESLDENNQINRSFEGRFREAFQKLQASDKYKGATEDKALKDFNENGEAYFQAKMDNIGKTLVDSEFLLNKAIKIAKTLLTDRFTKDVFTDDNEHIEHFAKLIIEWQYNTSKGQAIDCKSEVDLVKINHLKKIIYPIDLKTNFDNENFEYSYLRYRYDLQAAFYMSAINMWKNGEGMSEYTVFPMEFVVGDTSINDRRPIRYKLDMKDVTNAIGGYSIRGTKYKGLRQIVDEITWSETNNIWNCSKELIDNDGIAKLNLNYD